MSAINSSTPLLRPTPLSPARACLGLIGQKCRRFTRLANQGLVLALDVIFCAGKLSSNIPQVVTQATLTALGSVGLIALPYNFHFLAKSAKDALFAAKARHWPVMLLAGSKVLETTSNIALTALGFVAAVTGVAGLPLTQERLYLSMVAWGITTVALGTFNTISSIVLNARLLHALHSPIGLQRMQGALDALGADNPYSPLAQEAAVVRFCMDKDTLEKLLETLPETAVQSRKELCVIIIDNIHTQQRTNLGPQLVLVLIGDGLMVTEKYFTPNSVESAIVNLSMASAYSLKQLIETIREVRQRQRLQAAQEAVP